MKIHTLQIPLEGLHLEGEEPASILELGESDYTPAGPIHYSLDVGLSEDGLFATGTLAVDLDTTCVGCLSPFRLPVAVDDFACQVELMGKEEIDLTDLVREDILLALPPHPRCDWSGGKECPGVPRPPAVENDNGESRTDVWDALNQLKIR